MQKETEKAERLAEAGKQILMASRDELYLHMRFMDLALSSFFIYAMQTQRESPLTAGLYTFIRGIWQSCMHRTEEW